MKKLAPLAPLAPLALAVCLSLGFGLGTPARAGIFDDDEARKAIVDIRAKLDQVDQQTQKELAARKAETAELLEQVNIIKRGTLELNNQLEVMRTDLARLRGQDEQSTQSTRDVTRDLSELQRKQKDLLALLATLDERMKRLEPQKVSLDGKDVTVDSGEKKTYDDAIAILRRGEFAKAADALTTFQRRFPGSAYAGHVQYWLGNAQYGKGEVKDAMQTFRSLVNATPDHPRAAEALLALANCQVELKDNRAARKTLEELIKNYPQSEAAQAGRERLPQVK